MRRGRRWRAPLLRQALALLVPVFGLAGVAVFRAGMRLEKSGPRLGDLIGAVRVLLQDVTGNVVGPIVDVERLLRLDGRGKPGQQSRRGDHRGKPVQTHVSPRDGAGRSTEPSVR